jgi:hypothetical protein
MTELYDTVELAERIARIASQTNEPEIGRELMQIVDRLLTKAGLPELPAATQDDPHREP